MRLHNNVAKSKTSPGDYIKPRLNTSLCITLLGGKSTPIEGRHVRFLEGEVPCTCVSIVPGTRWTPPLLRLCPQWVIYVATTVLR